MATRRKRASPSAIDAALAANRLYGQRIVGDCMAPLVRDGDTVVCDPAADYGAGDLVVLYFRDGDGSRAIIKRLSMSVWEKVWPLKLHPDNELLSLVCFEQITPGRQYNLRGDCILGIHKVIAKATTDGKLIEDGFLERVEEHWRETCAQAERRAGYRDVVLDRTGAVLSA